MPDLIVLTVAEARIAALVGVERQIGSLRNGNRDRPGVKPASVWTIHIEGAAAELAFARRMGWYWDGSVGVFHDQGDVRNIHVRRRREHHWDLTIRPFDGPGVYALVTGIFPRYRVHGWCEWPGAPTYEAAYNPDREPARFVRQADLRPLEELTESVSTLNTR
jgi:hypothetical protein